ncbi:hypothetical protein AB4Z38_21950 [Arthrobacter sp. 2RAF6]|uniref:hypothetical protein n=1 Tax=Arthrobacter sp. 2RAF6 TaxID=3233002 RepID=UPI003F8FE7CA
MIRLGAQASSWRAEEQISVLCMASIGINAFNRLSILSEHPVRKALTYGLLDPRARNLASEIRAFQHPFVGFAYVYGEIGS